MFNIYELSDVIKHILVKYLFPREINKLRLINKNTYHLFNDIISTYIQSMTFKNLKYFEFCHIHNLMYVRNINIFDRMAHKLDFNNVLSFSCSNMGMTKLPYFPNIKFLYCDNNRLTHIPDMLCLEVLNCRGNNIKTMPYTPNLITML
jgi:hypothetical protein